MKVLLLGPALRAIGCLGIDAAVNGDRSTAKSLINRLGGMDRPYLFGNVEAWQARIAVRLGRFEAAYRLARLAFQKAKSIPEGLHEEEFEQLEEYEPFARFMQPRQ